MRRQEIAEIAAAGDRLAREGYWRGTVIGSAQILALLAGMSRDGVVMATGMFRAARPCSPACSPGSYVPLLAQALTAARLGRMAWSGGRKN